MFNIGDKVYFINPHYTDTRLTEGTILSKQRFLRIFYYYYEVLHVDSKGVHRIYICNHTTLYKLSFIKEHRFIDV
ncbi:hypothetical protein BKP45_05015 [Anaerobacillus alkalidiazotrophicus]|uniref:Uncharacterized protein n=1 Tax=Anaerobacillus alkalidiazotrophicus TaxID=472963 RepID=A0A1S2MBT2_9BACI|nr:hypothetical protein [Anaerobacillus alkalidiazotrophicus]OIJ22040.1 hypothetical protein BKP45_05015 [Anaerobacillus alkalidiazotrophicus]